MSVSGVSQFSHVISGDINLDILPLEQDMSDDPHNYNEASYIQVLT